MRSDRSSSLRGKIEKEIQYASISAVPVSEVVARPVRLPVEVSDVSAGSFTARGSVRLDRTEFGVTASPGLAARYLDVSLEVRCVARS